MIEDRDYCFVSGCELDLLVNLCSRTACLGVFVVGLIGSVSSWLFGWAETAYSVTLLVLSIVCGICWLIDYFAVKLVLDAIESESEDREGLDV